jgi:heptosyltransferase-2
VKLFFNPITPKLKKILIIQTASIGDVILSTGLAEKLHQYYPEATIHILVKKGMESLFSGHPFIKEVLVWDKKNHKYRNLFHLLQQIRHSKYDAVINVQRFLATGLLTGLSGARFRSGFDKNPLSFLFNPRIKHLIGEAAFGLHETERNQRLIATITDNQSMPPRLYPEAKDFEAVKAYKATQYVCIAPASLWNTKQFPAEKWIELIEKIPEDISVYLLGAASDKDLCTRIINEANRGCVIDLSGKLNLLQSAALIKDAQMNYVNDSAPLHLASAMNASVTAVFCSTIPEFGFGPLSDNATIIQTDLKLSCRPCGIHGHTECPEKHFKCAQTISTDSLLKILYER